MFGNDARELPLISVVMTAHFSISKADIHMNTRVCLQIWQLFEDPKEWFHGAVKTIDVFEFDITQIISNSRRIKYSCKLSMCKKMF